MKYRLTIDVNLMHADPIAPAMTTLKRWKSEGMIDLIEAEPSRSEREPAYGWPGAPTKPIDTNNPRRGGRNPVKRDAGASNFKSLAAVLFPYKDSQKLNMGEINDVAHLLKHHGSKNELFVTINQKDFIEAGKREQLKAAFGIIAMTPDEAVQMLSKIEGWKA